MWGFFIVSMVGIAMAIFMLLRRYCANSVSLTVKLVTAFAWLNCMAVVAIVPIDVYSTLNNQKPVELGYMWDVAFWTTQVLTWLLLPFFQYYAAAGDFTVKNKSIRSLKDNGILYGSVAVVGVVAIAVLLITKQMTFDALLGMGIGLSNAFGLIVSILLMGYGLVELPRHLWKSNPEQQLKWCEHRAGRFAESVMRSTSELEAVVTIINANERQMRRHDPLRKYMDIILANVEKESPIKPSDLAARGADIESIKAEDLEYNYDTKGLADLRGRLFSAIASYNADRKLYEEVMLQAFELEDIVKCRQLHDYTPRTPTTNTFKRQIWYYKCVLRQHWHQSAGVLLAMLSVLIVWAEATIVSPVDISPLSLMIKGTENSEFVVQVFTLVPLAYICASCYAALFSMTAFNYNKLVPRATTGEALMQNGTLMCRFAAPTCWNFYHMIRMTSTKAGETTVFTDKMGSMDVPPFLRSHLNTYLPMLLVVECLITLLNLWDRITGMCMSSKYRFSTDDIDDVYTEKGRLLIAKEREGVSKGFAIGEVLHAAYFDLQFPDINLGPRSRIHKKKGLFSNLFGGANKAPPTESLSRNSMLGGNGSGASTAAAPTAGPKTYKSATAAAAATRWLGREAVVAPPDEPTSASAASRSSLFGTRGGAAAEPPPSSADQGLNGLDGIFAGLNTRGAPPKPSGTSGPAAGDGGGQSLLGGMWRSTQ